MSSNVFSHAGFSGLATAAILEYTFVKQATTVYEQYKFAPCGATDTPFGIASDAASAEGRPVNAVFEGIGKLKVNGSSVNIAAGDKLKSGGATGVGIKATKQGEKYGAIALEPATTDGAIIRVRIVSGTVDLGTVETTDDTATVALTAATMGHHTTLDLGYAGAVALTVPAASGFAGGTKIRLKKTGSAGAITVTPAAGTINATTSHAAVDAQNDEVEYTADPIANDWYISASKIA